MTSRAEDYIAVRLEEAQESMAAARLLFESGFVKKSVSQLYYACFYAVEALLWTEKLQAKTHAGVRSLFHQHWLRAAKLPAEMGDFYQSMFEWRIDIDYESATCDRETVAVWLREAEGFVATITAKAKEQVAQKLHPEK
jgi:uncharacterized protein